MISDCDIEGIVDDIGGDTGSLTSGAEFPGEDGRDGDFIRFWSAGFRSFVLVGVSGGEVGSIECLALFD